MQKIVVNRCYGGYSLSKEAYNYLGLKWDGYGFAYDSKRDDSKLVKCVETLGERASGEWARLVIVEVPDDVEWEITDYDGIETVYDIHRRW